MRRFTYGLLAFIGLGLILQVLIPPASAQETACQYNLTDARLGLMAAEVPHVILPWNDRDHFVAMLESAFGINLPAITNVLIAQIQGGGVLRTGDSWVSYCSDPAFGIADGAAERGDGGRGVRLTRHVGQRGHDHPRNHPGIRVAPLWH